MKKVSFVKVAVITVVCIVVFLGLIYLNSFQFMGEKFIDAVYGAHVYVMPDQLTGEDMITAGYEHNTQVHDYILSKYHIDDNGWKIDFEGPTKVAPPCDEIANDEPAEYFNKSI